MRVCFLFVFLFLERVVSDSDTSDSDSQGEINEKSPNIEGDVFENDKTCTFQYSLHAREEPIAFLVSDSERERERERERGEREAKLCLKFVIGKFD